MDNRTSNPRAPTPWSINATPGFQRIVDANGETVVMPWGNVWEWLDHIAPRIVVAVNADEKKDSPGINDDPMAAEREIYLARLQLETSAGYSEAEYYKQLAAQWGRWVCKKCGRSNICGLCEGCGNRLSEQEKTTMKLLDSKLKPVRIEQVFKFDSVSIVEPTSQRQTRQLTFNYQGVQLVSFDVPDLAPGQFFTSPIFEGSFKVALEQT